MISKTEAISAARLELRGVTVRFGEFTANDAIDFTVGPGEIHALLGENGAGKTTLMRVVAGLLEPQQGEIHVSGERVHLSSPLQATDHGIGMVHQHFMLIPTLTVAQNVCLGLARAGRFFPDLRKVSAEVREISRRYRMDVDPAALVSELSVAGQQRVEIVKALYRGARILVLDEPTAVLSPSEVDGLFEVLRELAAEGTSIIFISHKLREVMAISDRVTVLRHGRAVATCATSDTSPAEISRLMIGGDLSLPSVTDPVFPTAEVLVSVEGMLCRNERGNPHVNGVDFVIRAGEIIGVAGVDGNGQQELAEALVGLRKIDAGTVRLGNRDITAISTGERIALGLAHIPEDRIRTALVDMSIRDNTVLETIGSPPFSHHGRLDKSAISAFAERLIADYDVRCTGPQQPILTLSGGNQQKVVLGRAMSRDPRFIIAVQPTRGLDIGASSFVHQQLIARRNEGAAILLVSTELEEILALSDRVLVMYSGRIVGDLSRQDMDIQRLAALMVGQTE